jgi:hypothetical protein
MPRLIAIPGNVNLAHRTAIDKERNWCSHMQHTQTLQFEKNKQLKPANAASWRNWKQAWGDEESDREEKFEGRNAEVHS